MEEDDSSEGWGIDGGVGDGEETVDGVAVGLVGGNVALEVGAWGECLLDGEWSGGVVAGTE